ncbi:hypothetical protein BJ742DRAFT_153745 [Cladochytrium replicatum]|nr:hypothetical protein BJ742DRAFT_153745 [Cladochytrium replicatum]
MFSPLANTFDGYSSENDGNRLLNTQGQSLEESSTTAVTAERRCHDEVDSQSLSSSFDKRPPHGSNHVHFSDGHKKYQPLKQEGSESQPSSILSNGPQATSDNEATLEGDGWNFQLVGKPLWRTPTEPSQKIKRSKTTTGTARHQDWSSVSSAIRSKRAMSTSISASSLSFARTLLSSLNSVYQSQSGSRDSLFTANSVEPPPAPENGENGETESIGEQSNLNQSTESVSRKPSLIFQKKNQVGNHVHNDSISRRSALQKSSKDRLAAPYSFTSLVSATNTTGSDYETKLHDLVVGELLSLMEEHKLMRASEVLSHVRRSKDLSLRKIFAKLARSRSGTPFSASAPNLSQLFASGDQTLKKKSSVVMSNNGAGASPGREVSADPQCLEDYEDKDSLRRVPAIVVECCEALLRNGNVSLVALMGKAEFEQVSNCKVYSEYQGMLSVSRS